MKCPANDIKLHPVVRLHFWSCERMESSLSVPLLPVLFWTQSGGTFQGTINDQMELFENYQYYIWMLESIELLTQSAGAEEYTNCFSAEG